MININIDTWKHKMRIFSIIYNLDIQEVYQRFILEEFAQMISHSDYKEQLILKEGLLYQVCLNLKQE